MRTYGRVYAKNPDGSKVDPQPAGYPRWVVVETSPDGFDDLVWATTLIQTLKLNLNESPFYASYGIPDQQAVIQQVAPDFYAARTQQQFSQYFANLVISRDQRFASPTYKVDITTQQGVKLDTSQPIPE